MKSDIKLMKKCILFAVLSFLFLSGMVVLKCFCFNPNPQYGERQSEHEQLHQLQRGVCRSFD